MVACANQPQLSSHHFIHDAPLGKSTLHQKRTDKKSNLLCKNTELSAFYLLPSHIGRAA